MSLGSSEGRRTWLRGAAACAILAWIAAPPARAQTPGAPRAPAPAARPTDADPAVEAVEEVVVTASRVPQRVEQLGTAVSVVDAEEIERQQLTVLDEALERVPGVAITRSGGFGQNTQVRMRGFTTKHVLIMVDGIKISNAAESSNQYGVQHLFLNNVERVEVLRGPQSGLYGADAVAGVINVITKRAEGPPKLRGSALYGSHDTYEAVLGSDGRLGSVGYNANVAYFQTEGISLASRPPGNVEPDGYVNLTMDGRVNWDVSESARLDAWVRYIEAENDTDNGFLPANNPQGLPAFLFQDSPGFVDNAQLFAAVKGELDMLEGRLTHTLQASAVDITSTAYGLGPSQDSESLTSEALYFATYRFAPDQFLLLGAEQRREQGSFEQPTGAAFAAVDESLTNTAAFATLNLSPAAGLHLSGAVRRDDNELFGAETTYRVTGAYNLPDSFGPRGLRTKLRASYGTGAEAPSLRQLLGSSPTFQGNPDLQPESTWMADVGLDQRLASGLARWSLTYYQGEATDGIFNIFDPATRKSSPQNIDSPVEMKGVEAELQLSPADWIDLDGAYTWAESYTVSDGLQLFGRPKHIASAAVTLRPDLRTTLTLDGYWRSSFYSDYPSTYVLPGYSLFNLTLARELSENLRLIGKVQNLFDEDYEEKLGDSTYGRTAQIRLSFVY